MSKSSFFELNDALCVSLYRAHRLMNSAYRKHLEPLKLTYTQFLVMICLWNNDKQTIKELGYNLHLNSGTLTPLVKRLMALDYIAKDRCQQDERVVYISLTPLGKKLKQKSESIPKDMFEELKLSFDEFVEIRTGVQQVVENLSSAMDTITAKGALS